MSRVLLLVLLAGASACDSGSDFTGFGGLSDDPALLVGTWEWTRSYRCGDDAGCMETTPGTTGTLVVADTTLSGYFDNATFPTPVSYRVGRERGEAVIRLDAPVVDAEVGYKFGVSPSRLVLGYTYVDGVRYETTYRRAR